MTNRRWSKGLKTMVVIVLVIAITAITPYSYAGKKWEIYSKNHDPIKFALQLPAVHKSLEKPIVKESINFLTKKGLGIDVDSAAVVKSPYGEDRIIPVIGPDQSAITAEEPNNIASRVAKYLLVSSPTNRSESVLFIELFLDDAVKEVTKLKITSITGHGVVVDAINETTYPVGPEETKVSLSNIPLLGSLDCFLCVVGECLILGELCSLTTVLALSCYVGCFTPPGTGCLGCVVEILHSIRCALLKCTACRVACP